MIFGDAGPVPAYGQRNRTIVVRLRLFLFPGGWGKLRVPAFRVRSGRPPTANPGGNEKISENAEFRREGPHLGPIRIGRDVLLREWSR